MAIAEWPTQSGPSDYAFFCGLTAVAVTEAKAAHRTIPGHLRQAYRYSRDFTDPSGSAVLAGPWRNYRIPFAYATNGRPFIRECKEESGIWFHDLRLPTNHPRPLVGWHSPAGLKGMLEAGRTLAASRGSRSKMEWLRDYQLSAIEAVEKQIAAGRREILVAMATGTGKTRVCLALLYRLLEVDKLRRILFLVDREPLGLQAVDVFNQVKVQGLRSFSSIYDIKELGEILPGDTTRVHFATVQGMVRRLLTSPSAAGFPVDLYDCVVVDECHRGYLLDRHLSAEERWFKDQDDYISKYRRVLDYFDAIKIGFTATPALHTTEIFGEPVFRYGYRQAVIDGWLVDHEPPIRIETRLTKKGIHWKKHAPLKTLEPATGIVRLDKAPDEIDFDVASFNRAVLTEPFNRTVCEHLAQEIDPQLPGKTLVFCANDRHADTFVRLFKASLEQSYGPVEDDLVQKITGSIDDPMGAIRAFKNEQHPKIAVTVDLLTTGVDVPEIVNLVFMRRVRSRILYDQMIGRATRLCPGLFGKGQDKEVFRIFDAVGLYEHIEDLTEMRPVAAGSAETLVELVERLTAPDFGGSRQRIREIVCVRARRKRNLMIRHAAKLREICGLNPDELLNRLLKSSARSVSALFAKSPGLAAFLDELQDESARRIPISEAPDTIARVSRGYGKAVKPEDYIESFGAWLKKNMNRIPALTVIAQRPADLTREHLRQVAEALEAANFTEANLRTAWRESSSVDAAATIIGFIRAKAVGSPLIPYATRVDRALRTLLSGRTWTAPQREWLKRLANQTKANIIVDRKALDVDYFASKGGFAILNRRFDGRLAEILREFKEQIWSDVA